MVIHCIHKLVCTQQKKPIIINFTVLVFLFKIFELFGNKYFHDCLLLLLQICSYVLGESGWRHTWLKCLVPLFHLWTSACPFVFMFMRIRKSNIFNSELTRSHLRPLVPQGSRMSQLGLSTWCPAVLYVTLWCLNRLLLCWVLLLDDSVRSLFWLCLVTALQCAVWVSGCVTTDCNSWTLQGGKNTLTCMNFVALKEENKKQNPNK